ncbi:MAG: DUF4147 domain-containing protein [Thermomicrobiales bacterium]|nr:DUF4147 domain-containing protein [Thermomicrobiales bacterium]
MPTASFELIRHLYERGLASVDPATVTKSALADLNTDTGKLIVLAIGKAAVPMAQAARDIYGDRIDAGLLVTKQGQYTAEVEGFVGIEAGHPVPNLPSLQAGELALDIVADLTSGDTVLALISGGGSALMEAPVEGVSLAELQVTTEMLMHAGADIYDLNTVRKTLSQIKGGGLRRAIGAARCITLLLSDVLGNDRGVIASGPTILESIDPATDWKILKRHRVQDRVPESVLRVLQADPVPIEEVDTSRDIVDVIADNDTMIAAVAGAAESEGFTVQIAWPDWRGDARELGQRIVDDCLVSSTDVLIGGGEATCRVRGNGRGGRNSEAALITALALRGNDEWTVASLASDGDDGNSHAAGAIIDGTIIDDASAALAALEESNSAGYLSDRKALLVPGPTGTNVNDIYIAVRRSAAEGGIA